MRPLARFFLDRPTPLRADCTSIAPEGRFRSLHLSTVLVQRDFGKSTRGSSTGIMSLNGLDAEVINEAYQAVLRQPGAWFLLRYLSRDEVCLFKEGGEGYAQARGAVSEYEDKSPLFGLTEYGGRKVLLKYVPEGTSRLLQGEQDPFSDWASKYIS